MASVNVAHLCEWGSPSPAIRPDRWGCSVAGRAVAAVNPAGQVVEVRHLCERHAALYRDALPPRFFAHIAPAA
jgi:hypothetical protein